ncbi:MAG: hypothetical protein ABIA67_01865, partial [Candidatus Margulisiibacteriota bacterium]
MSAIAAPGRRFLSLDRQAYVNRALIPIRFSKFRQCLPPDRSWQRDVLKALAKRTGAFPKIKSSGWKGSPEEKDALIVRFRISRLFVATEITPCSLLHICNVIARGESRSFSVIRPQMMDLLRKAQPA